MKPSPAGLQTLVESTTTTGFSPTGLSMLFWAKIVGLVDWQKKILGFGALRWAVTAASRRLTGSKVLHRPQRTNPPAPARPVPALLRRYKNPAPRTPRVKPSNQPSRLRQHSIARNCTGRARRHRERARAGKEGTESDGRNRGLLLISIARHEDAAVPLLRGVGERGGREAAGAAAAEEGGSAADAERDGAAALAVAGRPVDSAGVVGAARLHAGGAERRHARGTLHRGGRVRPRLQGIPRRASPPRGAAAAARRRQVPRRRRAAGPPRVAGRGGVPGDAEASASGEAHRVRVPGRAEDAGVRVYAQRQPRAPPLQQSAVDLAVVHAAEDRGGRGKGAGVPARGRHARHLPRLQGLQHPARFRLHGKALGLWPGQGRSTGRRHPRHHPCHGDTRLRRAGVHSHRAPDGEERRVQLRRGAPGAAVGAAQRGQAAARAGAAPRGLGAPVPAPPGAAAPGDGPHPGRPVLRRGRARGRRGRLPLPAQRAQVPPRHARRRRRARAAARRRVQQRRARGPLRLHGIVLRRARRRRGGGRRRCRREQVPRVVGRARRGRAADGGQPTVRELRGGAQDLLAQAEHGQGSLGVRDVRSRQRMRVSSLCSVCLFPTKIVKCTYYIVSVPATS